LELSRDYTKNNNRPNDTDFLTFISTHHHVAQQPERAHTDAGIDYADELCNCNR